MPAPELRGSLALPDRVLTVGAHSAYLRPRATQILVMVARLYPGCATIQAIKREVWGFHPPALPMNAISVPMSEARKACRLAGVPDPVVWIRKAGLKLAYPIDVPALGGADPGLAARVMALLRTHPDMEEAAAVLALLGKRP